MRLEVPSTLLLLLTTVAIGTAHAQKREHDAHEHGHGALNIVIADGEMLVEMEVPGVHVAGFEHVPKTDAERAAVDAVVKRMRDGERWFVASTGAGCELEHAEVAMSYDEHHDDHDKHAKHDDHDHGKHKKHDDHDHDKHAKHDDHGHGKHKKHDDHDHDKHAKHDDHDHGKHKKHDDHDKHAKHDDHDHGKHKKHDDHDHDKHKHDDEEEAHSSLHAEYHFECANVAALKEVRVDAFDGLSKLETLSAQIATAARQTRQTLRPNARVVRLAP